LKNIPAKKKNKHVAYLVVIFLGQRPLPLSLVRDGDLPHHVGGEGMVISKFFNADVQSTCETFFRLRVTLKLGVEFADLWTELGKGGKGGEGGEEKERRRGRE
jgi:hypothetical protein